MVFCDSPSRMTLLGSVLLVSRRLVYSFFMASESFTTLSVLCTRAPVTDHASRRASLRTMKAVALSSKPLFSTSPMFSMYDVKPFDSGRSSDDSRLEVLS